MSMVQPPRSSARVIGWLCLTPALALVIWQFVVPAAQTATASFYRSRLIRPGSDSFVGLDNYLQLDLMKPLLFGFVVGIPAALIAGLAGVAIGGLAARASGPLRTVVRVLLGVMLPLYAPVGIALAVSQGQRGSSPGMLTVFMMISIVLLPMLTALSAVVMLATASGSDEWHRRQGPAVAAVVVLGAISTVALGLQSLELPLVTTAGGPQRSTETVGITIYQRTFAQGDVGGGSAASIVLLVPIAVLGVLSVAALLALRTRVQIAPRSGGQAVLGVGAIVTTVAVLVVFAVLARGWLAGLTVVQSPGLSTAEATRILVNTFVPPAIAVAVQLLVAVLAAVGIGVLRPLGDRSEWLLLAFSPWLFVGLLPQVVSRFRSLVAAGGLREGGLFGLVPPTLLSVPLLVVLTFVFAGCRQAWSDPAQRLRSLIAATSAVGLVGVVSYVITTQGLLWNLVVGTEQERASGPAYLTRLAFGYRPSGQLPQQLATPVPMLLLLGAVGALAVVGLDRLTVRVGAVAPPSRWPG